MMEGSPDFVVQSAEPMTKDERWNWFQTCAREMREKKATWLQMSFDPKHDPMITLIEGWLVRPQVQPEPHFQMVCTSAG